MRHLSHFTTKTSKDQQLKMCSKEARQRESKTPPSKPFRKTKPIPSPEKTPLTRPKRKISVDSCIIWQVVVLSLLVTLNHLSNTPQLFQFHGIQSVKSLTDQCPLRNLTEYSSAIIGNVHKTKLSTTLSESNCLSYNCTFDYKTNNECDSGLPTNYDGPKPPCCTHILRDMSRIFDDHMCSLGLDYAVDFGTLLGFRRNDSIIPWTLDNDYIIPSSDVANAMVSLWDTNLTGMAHIFQGINRMCVTPDFAGGVLKEKWGLEKPPNDVANLDWTGMVYIDFYLGRNVMSQTKDEKPYRNETRPTTVLHTIDNCRHWHSDVFPTRRELVYDGAFAQRFPANSEQLLREKYGRNWRIPPSASKKDGHGSTRGGCAPTDPVW